MGKTEDGETTTATVDKGTDAPETPNLKPGEDDKKPDASGDGTAPAADEDDAGASDDDSSGADEDEGDDDSDASKQRNREGFQLRQLIDSSPVVGRIREKLSAWVEAGADDREIKDRQRDLNDYVKDVVRAQDDINRDNIEVAREIPLFRPGHDDFNESLTKRAYAQYARDMAIEDQNGITVLNSEGKEVPLIVGYRMRLLDYMREKAEDYGYAGSKPKPSQDKSGKTKKLSKAEMDARSDTPGGASPGGNRSANKESFDDLFMKGMDDPYGRHTPKDTHAYN